MNKKILIILVVIVLLFVVILVGLLIDRDSKLRSMVIDCKLFASSLPQSWKELENGHFSDVKVDENGCYQKEGICGCTKRSRIDGGRMNLFLANYDLRSHFITYLGSLFYPSYKDLFSKEDTYRSLEKALTISNYDDSEKEYFEILGEPAIKNVVTLEAQKKEGGIYFYRGYIFYSVTFVSKNNVFGEFWPDIVQSVKTPIFQY